MGCELTKLAASEVNHDAIDRPPPPADPRSPLTTKQQYCMLASWKGIFRQIEKTGIILFINKITNKWRKLINTITTGYLRYELNIEVGFKIESCIRSYFNILYKTIISTSRT
ncbi:hypothetical protein ABMA28_017181 [Loxostege sticticalis]|uniref:Uncharacterized protein n=1 Tax=Loxostege sticticalis TaxID=481309 RepID=A0ABD0S2H5_LOXSC